MALILAIFLVGLTGALAQNVTVIGPITPGDCAQFSSTTVVKDAGSTCGGGGAGVPGGVNGSIQFNNSSAFGGFTASGDATINTGSGVVTVTANAVTNAKAAQMPRPPRSSAIRPDRWRMLKTARALSRIVGRKIDDHDRTPPIIPELLKS